VLCIGYGLGLDAGALGSLIQGPATLGAQHSQLPRK
jgi:hypothetical protein